MDQGLDQANGRAATAIVRSGFRSHRSRREYNARPRPSPVPAIGHLHHSEPRDCRSAKPARIIRMKCEWAPFGAPTHCRLDMSRDHSNGSIGPSFVNNGPIIKPILVPDAEMRLFHTPTPVLPKNGADSRRPTKDQRSISTLSPISFSAARVATTFSALFITSGFAVINLSKAAFRAFLFSMFLTLS